MIAPSPQKAEWPWQKEIFLQLQLTPWIMLENSLYTAESLREAQRLLPRFVSHRPHSQQGAGRWMSLSLKAAGGVAEQTNLPSGQGEFSLTEIAALCPATMHLLAGLTDIDQCERIRFMLLEPGAEITVHSDAPDKPTSLALNIALNMPAGCEFWVDLDPDGSLNPYSRKIPIQAGSAFLFNSSTYHRVVNLSTEPRFHLIAHGPIRYEDKALIQKARAQNHARDIRHATNLLLRKKLETGEPVKEGDPVYCDFFNFGALFDFLPGTTKIALVTEELPDPGLAKEALLVTSAGLNNIPHEVVRQEFIADWLARQAEAGASTAVLIAAGTQIIDPTTFVVELVRETTHLRKNQAGLAGHILHRNGNLPYLHEQFLLLDLKAWRESGCPGFSSGAATVFPGFERASECVHDDYTPLWLKPTRGPEQTGQARFGTSALSALLAAGRSVLNLSAGLRAQKDYMYPREGRGQDYLRVRASIDRYLKEKEEKVYVYNTETMPVEDFSFRPNTLITPCAGFKPFFLMRQFGLHSGNARFLFLEKNRRALDYYRALLECNSLTEVFALQEATLARQSLLPTASGYVKKMTSAMISELFGGNAAEFLACLREMRANSYFEQIDYLNEPNRIAALIQPKDRVLFWHSNVWEYTAAFYQRSPAELRENYLALVNLLSEKSGQPALVHEESYKAVIGADFLSPQIVLTAGGSKIGKPSRKSFVPASGAEPSL